MGTKLDSKMADLKLVGKLNEDAKYKDYDLVRPSIFFKAWLILIVLVLAVSAAILTTLISFGVLPVWTYSLMIIIALVLAVYVWQSRIEVTPRWELLWEWEGKKGVPLPAGWYFPPRFLGFFRSIARIPMYVLDMGVLSGTEDGLDANLIKSHAYGTRSDIEPKSGAVLRLIYTIRVQVFDALSLYYNMTDAYTYLAYQVEKEMVAYAKMLDSESITDDFHKHDWEEEVVVKLFEKMLDEIGVKILEIIPQDVIHTQEIQDLRNKTGEEKVREELLIVQLRNKDQEIGIAKKDNQMTRERIEAIKESLGGSDELAATVLTRQLTLATIEKSAGKGMTYVDDANKSGVLSGAHAMSFAISSAGKGTDSKDSDKEKKEKK